MIKLRAWDEETQRMFNIARFDFADYTVYSHLFACDGYLGENLEIMQTTGLKDKNDVEIFEGDIVNVYEFINVGGIEGYEEGEREMIGIVKYGCIFNSPIPEWYLENSNDYIPFSYIDLHDESFEVIGNIYENGDLLK